MVLMRILSLPHICAHYQITRAFPWPKVVSLPHLRFHLFEMHHKASTRLRVDCHRQELPSRGSISTALAEWMLVRIQYYEMVSIQCVLVCSKDRMKVWGFISDCLENGHVLSDLDQLCLYQVRYTISP